jgi:poly(3-hydroxybutyrate) depolymerase
MPLNFRVVLPCALSCLALRCVESSNGGAVAGGTDAGVDAATLNVDAAGSADANRRPDFIFTGKSADACTLSAALCANWPDGTNGALELYASTENFAGKTLDRTYHVYVPKGLAAKVPLVIALHGGTSSGSDFVAGTKFTQIVDARGENPGIAWRKNTPQCKRGAAGFVDGNGAVCVAPTVLAQNSLRAIAVFPDGLPDTGAVNDRHWEDGRTPSPGNGMSNEQRNDTGFIDHIISVMLASGLPIDSEAIYVMGISNGGMMTQRLVCNAGNPAYPNLGKVAAFAAGISALPETLANGLDGRERCASQPAANTPLMLIVGSDLPTPDCATWPCKTPTVSGDGTMPFGVAGSSYYVNSPDKGRVVSSADTQALWIVRAGAGTAAIDTSDSLGFFTTRKLASYPSGADFEVLETQGGAHTLLGVRADVDPFVRMWRFMSAHRRNPAGAVSRIDPTWVTGEY